MKTELSQNPCKKEGIPTPGLLVLFDVPGLCMQFLARYELAPWQDFDVRAPLPDVLTGESGIS